MERCFLLEAKRFSFSAKSEVSNLRLEERRKGFCGFTFLGPQASVWLLSTVEEALMVSAMDFVKYFWVDIKVLMVRRGVNKSGRYLEVVVFAEGGRKGAIWLFEGRKGGGWARFAGELRKMTSFLGSKERMMGSETFFFESAGWVFHGSFLRGCGSGVRCLPRHAYWEATVG